MFAKYTPFSRRTKEQQEALYQAARDIAWKLGTHMRWDQRDKGFDEWLKLTAVLEDIGNNPAPETVA